MIWTSIIIWGGLNAIALTKLFVFLAVNQINHISPPWLCQEPQCHACPPRKSPWFSWSLMTGRGLLAYFLTNNADPIPQSHWHAIQFRTHHRTCEDASKTGTSKHEIRSRVFFPLISCNYILIKVCGCYSVAILTRTPIFYKFRMFRIW